MRGSEATERREGLGGGYPPPEQGNVCILRLKNKLYDAYLWLYLCEFIILLNKGNLSMNEKIAGEATEQGRVREGDRVSLWSRDMCKNLYMCKQP